MIQGIDHVVIVVQDLAAASRDYAALGFTVTPGGTHADGQTHNALIAFADGVYLELIAFVQPAQPSAHYWWPRLAEGEGLEDFCLLSDDLAGDAMRWQAAGLAAQGPNPGGRQRPDGVALRWQTVRVDQPAGAALLPFVIQDATPRGLRVPGDAATHYTVAAHTITRVQGVRVATTDLQAAMHAYITLLGITPIGQTTTSARFALGNQWIALHTPMQPDDAIAQTIHAHGAGPYALVLGSEPPNLNDPPLSLDVTLTHGAEIWVA